METLLPGDTNAQSYSPQLKTVLKTYQLSAVKSLQGPSSALLGMDCKGLLQEPANFRFSPPACTGNCLDVVSEHVPIKEVEKREASPVPIAAPCKDLRLEQPHDDSDDDPPDRLKVGEKRELEFQIPILTAPDQCCSERCETLLEGERISCFVVGGERRLCLPQILNTVLQDFSLQQINQVCDELQIYCSRCTRDQLEELKLSGILPRNAPSCGLITQTDAERLVSALLSRAEPYLEHDLIAEEKRLAALEKVKAAAAAATGASAADADKEQQQPPGGISRFKVYHECFGKCKGIFDADCFESEDSACIECLECGCRLPPQRFVRHAHGSLENRTCHWGFDSSNWRSYLLLSRDQQPYSKISNFFKELKERKQLPNSTKRKFEVQHESEKLMKKLKKDIGRDEFAGMYNGNGLGLYHPVTAAAAAAVADPYLRMQWAVFELAAREASAFRPWNPAGSCKHRESSPLVPAYLSRGPPVLQHPERVVPMSECERFEPHFQPNVALAPIPAPLVPPPPPPPPQALALVPPVPTSVVAAVPPPLPTGAPPPAHRPYHRSRHSAQPRSVSPEEKVAAVPVAVTTSANPTLPEPFTPVSVKIEKPSSPCPLPEQPVAPAVYTPVLRCRSPLAPPPSAPRCRSPLVPPPPAPRCRSPLAPPPSTPRCRSPLAPPPSTPRCRSPLAPPSSAPRCRSPLAPPTSTPRCRSPLAQPSSASVVQPERTESKPLQSPQQQTSVLARADKDSSLLPPLSPPKSEDRIEKEQQPLSVSTSVVVVAEREEDESSTAVTSSTSTLVVEPVVPASAAATVPVVSRTTEPASSASPKPSDSAEPGVELEERLLAIDAPSDVLELARRLCTELAMLRCQNTRLRSELHLQQQQQQRKNTEDLVVDVTGQNKSCDPADSTENATVASGKLPEEKSKTPEQLTDKELKGAGSPGETPVTLATSQPPTKD